MVQQVVAFVTSDGEKFTTELEANAHEELLQIGGAIDAYVAEAGLAKAEAKRAERYISQFQTFMKTYTGTSTRAPVEKAPKGKPGRKSKAELEAKAAAEAAAAAGTSAAPVTTGESEEGFASA